jgi:methylphosphotriester-DNA--protein-cysteine methyltransferase
MRKFLLSFFVLLALLFAGFAVETTALSWVDDARAASITYHGNKRSHIFHQPGCRYYNCKNCVVVFTTREKALAAGFRPCKICKP